MTDEHAVRETVRNIWTTVLRAEVDDSADFYNLGGHSFAAVQIITKLNEELPVATSVTVLFDNPRFADFVSALAWNSRPENDRRA
jgi:acyl carrier protein